MVRKYVIAFAIICLMTAFAVTAYGEEKAEVKHDFVGAKKCSICHKKDNVYPSWLETKHAKAWKNLSAEQQKDENCNNRRMRTASVAIQPERRPRVYFLKVFSAKPVMARVLITKRKASCRTGNWP